jgi:hypothetical protein
MLDFNYRIMLEHLILLVPPRFMVEVSRSPASVRASEERVEATENLYMQSQFSWFSCEHIYIFCKA